MSRETVKGPTSPNHHFGRNVAASALAIGIASTAGVIGYAFTPRTEILACVDALPGKTGNSPSDLANTQLMELADAASAARIPRDAVLGGDAGDDYLTAIQQGIQKVDGVPTAPGACVIDKFVPITGSKDTYTVEVVPLHSK